MSLIESRLKEYNFSSSLKMDSKLTNGIIYLKEDDHRKAVVVPGENDKYFVIIQVYHDKDPAGITEELEFIHENFVPKQEVKLLPAFKNKVMLGDEEYGVAFVSYADEVENNLFLIDLFVKGDKGDTK